jgi:hypothetical protein
MPTLGESAKTGQYSEMKYRMKLGLVFVSVAVFGVAAAAQSAPSIIAWQAPTGPGVTLPAPACLATYSSGYYNSFLSTALPGISGIGVTVYWSCVDNCSTTAPCATPVTTGCPSGNWESCFDWSYLDEDLLDYIRNTVTPFTSKKIVLIINPESDSGGVNAVTPQYVFSSNYASSISANLQDVVVCKSWPGGGVMPPVSGSFGPSDFGIWNKNNCSTIGAPTCSCTGPSCGFTNFSGFPVVYEKPILTAYQNFLQALFLHYSSQGSGQQIAPYILYARIGLSHGGENYPECATKGSVPPTANSTWPGPQGQFGPTRAEPWQTASSYTDAGYLTLWQTPADGTGYITVMMQFLNTYATFPVTVTSANGPPGHMNQAYADLEAQLATQNNVGFGNQALNIYDTILAAAGTPSVDDWVENFKNYPYAPVHHLQTYSPGNGGMLASGFAITSINVSSGTATVTCAGAADCSFFCPGFIYIVGNDSPALDGVFPTDSSCTSPNVTFTPTQPVMPNTYSNGTMWGSDYWPITMPFATQQKATSVEVWECDLDFAFNSTTTSGCVNSLTSPNADYENAVTNTLVGIPFGTGFHTYSLYNGWQF